MMWLFWRRRKHCRLDISPTRAECLVLASRIKPPRKDTRTGLFPRCRIEISRDSRGRWQWGIMSTGADISWQRWHSFKSWNRVEDARHDVKMLWKRLREIRDADDLRAVMTTLEYDDGKK